MPKALPKFRVYISDVCQLNCQFCGGNSSTMESFQDTKLEYKCSIEDVFSILQAYAAAGGKDVQLTGGEPLLNPQITDIVRKIVSMGLRAEINTNGIALTEQMAMQLKESGLKDIKFSLPAFERMEYQRMTKHDHFDRVCENIMLAGKYLDVRINTVATVDSMDHLDEMIAFCKSHNIKNLALLELCYYPELITKTYFMEQHVDFVKEYMPIFEQKLNGKMNKLAIREDFVTPVYFIRDSESDFSISYKCAKPVYRCEECKRCDTFCQEGIYQLRLSSGGYLNFCNYVTNLGIELHKILGDQAALIRAFETMGEKWASIREGDPDEFFVKMRLQ